MITIAILFAFISIFEWRYLHQKKRKPRTYRIVFGFVISMFLCFEALYYFREQFMLANVIEMVFDPIEKFILWRAEKNE